MMLALDTVLRVSLIVLLALGCVLLLRRRSAALRHWVLAVGLACAAVTPFLQLVLPPLTIDVAPFAPSTTADADEPTVATSIVVQPPERPLPGAASDSLRARGGVNLPALLTTVWLAGVTLSGSTLLVGLWRLSRLASRARRIDAGRLVSLSSGISGTIGIRRRVALLESDAPALPVTWGLVAPKIILPANAAGWSDELARVVLYHELEHIRRRDWATQLIAETLRAVNWFNPLFWIASRRLRHESERACDDAVLERGVEPAAYATHLLDLARTLNAARQAPGPALAVARPSSLEGRISAMLNAHVNHRPLTRAARLATASLLLGLAIPVAIAAQHRFSTFTGTIVDQTNRFVPAATVTLTNASTGAKYEVRSDGAGRFELAGVLPGDYLMTVAHPGFAMVKENVSISGDFNRTIMLQVGSVRETITLSATATATTAHERSAEERQQARLRAESTRQRVAAKCAPGAAAAEVGGSIVPPMKLVDVKPAYPEQMRTSGVDGAVTLDAIIATDGTVRDVKTVTASTPEFEAAAIDAVRQWEFSPTYLNCTPIEVTMHVTLNFVPKR